MVWCRTSRVKQPANKLLNGLLAENGRPNFSIHERYRYMKGTDMFTSSGKCYLYLDSLFSDQRALWSVVL